MDFAADAVIDVIAPAPRAPREPAAQPSDTEQPEFGDILDAATREDEQPSDAEQSAKKPKTDEQPSAAVPAPQEQIFPSPALISLLAMQEPAQQAGAENQAAPMATEQTKLAKSLEAAEKSEAPVPAQFPTEASQHVAASADIESTAQPVAPSAAPVAVLAAAPAPLMMQIAATAAPPEQAAPSADADIAAIQSVQVPAAVQRPIQPRQPQEPRAGASSTETAENNGEAGQSAAKAADVDFFKAALKDAVSQGNDRAAPAAADRTSASPTAHQSPAGAPPAPAMTMTDASAVALSNASAATATDVAASHAQAARTAPVAQVAHDIIRRFDGGSTKFELRLDPPELGRVEVRLEVSRDHRVTAVIAADNPQALAELARHARDLQQTLQSAGLTLSDNGLSFDLRQGGDHSAPSAHNSDGSNATGSDEASAGLTETTPTSARPIGFERWRGVRVDITV